MSVFGEGLDFVKASKEWKEEYEIKHDKDIYIHRITDLNNKLCEENVKLKQHIDDLINIINKQSLNYEFDEYQVEILDILLNEERVHEKKLLSLLPDKLEYKLALNKLNKAGYVNVIENDIYHVGESTLRKYVTLTDDKKDEIMMFFLQANY